MTARALSSSSPVPRASTMDLRAYWMPSTGNRDSKKNPRIVGACLAYICEKSEIDRMAAALGEAIEGLG